MENRLFGIFEGPLPGFGGRQVGVMGLRWWACGKSLSFQKLVVLLEGPHWVNVRNEPMAMNIDDGTIQPMAFEIENGLHVELINPEDLDP